MKSDIEKLADCLMESKYAVALTGAGISTESGIPDFRGPGGLWQNVDSTEILSREMLYYRPEHFYSSGLELLNIMRNKDPNPAHKALALLEQRGLIQCVITQNIDGLHHKAGSKNVIEVHGDLRTAFCDACGREFPFEFLLSEAEEGIIPPKCTCGGIIRPNVVLFGDPMPPYFEDAIIQAKRADFMLVVGSSLQVAPVSYLPRLSRQIGIINLEPTPYDRAAAVVIHEKAGSALTDLIKVLDERH